MDVPITGQNRFAQRLIDLTNELQSLRDQAASIYMQEGKIYDEIEKDSLYSYGYDSLKDYLAQADIQTDIWYKKKRVYQAFSEALGDEVPPSLTRMRMIVAMASAWTLEQKREWIAKAHTLSMSDFLNCIAEYEGKTPMDKCTHNEGVKTICKCAKCGMKLKDKNEAK